MDSFNSAAFPNATAFSAEALTKPQILASSTSFSTSTGTTGIVSINKGLVLRSKRPSPQYVFVNTSSLGRDLNHRYDIQVNRKEVKPSTTSLRKCLQGRPYLIGYVHVHNTST